MADETRSIESEALAFRKAKLADAAAVVQLVNSAYRGEVSKQGWTTEADLLDGQRTDLEEISTILADSHSIILLCLAGDELVASAHLQHLGKEVHFGMFAVKPGLQNSGIGKRFMAEAENVARHDFGATKMLMAVITLRDALIGFYERRGYRRTGIYKEFPQSHKFGIPKVGGLRLEMLEKALDN